MTKSKLEPSRIEAKALAAIRDQVNDLDLLVRHVRGHKRGQKRQWVNRLCDAEVRRHMLAERKRLDAALGHGRGGSSAHLDSYSRDDRGHAPARS